MPGIHLYAAQPAVSPEALLLEWEQFAPPVPSAAYHRARAGFLAHFQLLSHIIDIDTDVNVDVLDVRNMLRRASSLRVGSAGASGPDRATQVAAAALASCHQCRLGLAIEQPASAALLSLVCTPTAELEMDELTTITEHLQAQIGGQADVLFGLNQTTDALDGVQLCLLLSYGPPLAPALPALPRQILPAEDVFQAAVRLVVQHQRVSLSFLQRRLKTGYNQTCRLLDELEAAGVTRRRDEIMDWVVVQKTDTQQLADQ
jgi:hypothetical protein